MADFETFYLQFKADASQLKKEVDDVNKKTKETTENFKETEEQTKKTDDSFDNLGKTLSKVGATYFSVTAIINGFRSSFAHTTEVGQVSRDLGLSTEIVDSYGKALKKAGFDANAFFSAVESMRGKLNTSGAVAFEFLTGPVADTLHGLSPSQAQIYGQDTLGLSPEQISYLSQGSKKVREDAEFEKRLGTITQEDVDRQLKFNASVSRLTDSFDRLFRSLSVFVIPILDALVRALTFIVELFNKVITAYLSAFGEFSDAIFGDGKEKKGFQLDPNNDFGKFSELFKKEYAPQIESLNDSSVFKYLITPSHVPTTIPQVTNSQARNLSVNAINIHSNSQDPHEVANLTVAKLNFESLFLNQVQQSNAFHDNAVVV